MTSVDLLLVRHGLTEATVAGRYSGSADAGPPLTPAGRVQAAQAADLVARVGLDVWPELPRPSSVLASPMLRTQQTAAAVGRRIGVVVRTVDALAESAFGEWEGSTAQEIDQRWPGQLTRWLREPTFAPPGGESLTAVGDRVAPVLARLRADPTPRTVVLVSHSVTIRVVLGLALRAPAQVWGRVRVAPGSISVVRLLPDDEAEVRVVGAPAAR